VLAGANSPITNIIWNCSENRAVALVTVIREAATQYMEVLWAGVFSPARPSSAPVSASLRQAQGRPFDRLRAGPSTGSGQALRQAQGRLFDRLRAGPSTGSGQALRQAQGRPFGRTG
jgi:hypothetical protein